MGRSGAVSGETVDALIQEAGEIGPYHALIWTLLLIPAALLGPFIAFNQVFASASPDHWCRIPELEVLVETGLYTVEEVKNFSIPKEKRNGELVYSQCRMYDVNYTTAVLRHPDVTWRVTSCQHGWTYDRTLYDRTLVTQFDLVCDDSWWPAFSTAIFHFGNVIGIVLFGWVADKYGRRIGLFVDVLAFVILQPVSVLSPSFFVYSVFRFFMGLTFPACFQIPFVLAVELTTTRYSTMIGTLMSLVFGFGMATLALLAWWLRDSQALLLVTSLPFISLLSYWWIVPESPRWLLTQGHIDRAEKLLISIARANKRQLQPGFLVKELNYRSLINANDDEWRDRRSATNRKMSYFQAVGHARRSSCVSPLLSQKGPTLLDLFKTPNLRKKTILLSFIWTTNELVYVGLSYMSSSLKVSEFLAFAISGLVEAPSCLLAWYAMQHWGRRKTTCMTMMIVGIVCTATIAVPEDNVWLGVILPSIGKSGITTSFCIVYVYGSELQPTVVRNIGLGFCSLLGAGVLIAAPYMITLTTHMRVLPLVLMGILSLGGALAAIFLPETINAGLPQTLEDGENFGKDMKICPCISEDIHTPDESDFVD